jgi:peptide chain release factor 3
LPLRDTPILTFINKLDREIREPMELLDEVERELKIKCAPITWPIGWAVTSRASTTSTRTRPICISRPGPSHPRSGLSRASTTRTGCAIGRRAAKLRDELELVQGASHEFDHDAFLAGEMTPVFFGTALGNFGVDHMLDGFTDWAPCPGDRKAAEREVVADRRKVLRLRVQDPGEHGPQAP